MSLKIRAVLLPQKHISFSGSLIGLAGRVRSALAKTPCSIDELIAKLRDDSSNSFPSVEHLILAITLLYAIRRVHMDDQGRLVVTP